MNYEKIIVELLSRIQVLEEKVEILMEQQDCKRERVGEKMSTEQIREYIEEFKRVAKETGKDMLILRSGNIHKELNLKDAMPSVCNAMRQCMDKGDRILHTTPSGNSSTILIQYNL